MSDEIDKLEEKAEANPGWFSAIVWFIVVVGVLVFGWVILQQVVSLFSF